MRLLRAFESVMSTGHTVWLNCFLAAAALFAMAAIVDGSGLGFAGMALTWAAILPLGMGVFSLADGVRESMRASA